MSISRFFSRHCLTLILAGSLAPATFANNVSAVLEGSLLKVFGDNAANSVLISRTSAGDVEVSGRSGTRVNGVASVRFRRLQLNAAEIRMEGGNDSVTLSGIVTGNDLYISLGAGADRLETTAPVTVGANLSIESGEGADNIRLTDITAVEDIYIDGGLDALTVALAGVDAGKSLSIVSDEAGDSVSISNSVVAELLSVESKAGNNSVRIDGVLALAMLVSSDLGVDSISVLNTLTSEDVGVFTGPGNDTVSLTNVDSGKSMTVSVDEGADNVTGTSVTVAEDAVFEGGAGTDTLTDLGIIGGIKKDIKEFEVLLP